MWKLVSFYIMAQSGRLRSSMTSFSLVKSFLIAKWEMEPEYGKYNVALFLAGEAGVDVISKLN